MALRFLLVDDNPRVLEAARDFLERDGINFVGVASTGSEALQRVEALRPDVVLIDLDLGDESGFDLAVALAEGTEVARAARVVLISAYPEAEFGDLIDASPALGFVAKADLSAQALFNVLGDDGEDECASDSRGR
jgi:DNA-binding NarL/FixJ family response regulator